MVGDAPLYLGLGRGTGEKGGSGNQACQKIGKKRLTNQNRRGMIAPVAKRNGFERGREER